MFLFTVVLSSRFKSRCGARDRAHIPVPFWRNGEANRREGRHRRAGLPADAFARFLRRFAAQTRILTASGKRARQKVCVAKVSVQRPSHRGATRPIARTPFSRATRVSVQFPLARTLTACSSIPRAPQNCTGHALWVEKRPPRAPHTFFARAAAGLVAGNHVLRHQFLAPRHRKATFVPFPPLFTLYITSTT